MLVTAVAAALAAVLAGCATRAARAGARRSGFVCQPNPLVARHVRAIPLGGGIAWLVAGTVAYTLVAFLPAAWNGALARSSLETAAAARIAAGAAAFLALGVIDDVARLSPGVKFTLQVLASMLAIAVGAVGACESIAEALAAALWILCIVNAFNFVDVCDGLALTLACVFFVLAGVHGHAPAVFLATCAGATAGVWWFNRPPAAIFLGDAGSLVLGFLVAVIAWRGLGPLRLDRAIPLACVVAVPLFETAFITALRLHRRAPWWRGSRDHFALRLQAGGWSPQRVDVAAGLVAAALFELGAWWDRMPHGARWTLLAVALVMIAVAAAHVLSVSKRPAD
jgi:UDP-GlcNAc:undecaprenyl-phosphate GlcNAc-1-phosphate transferase